MEESDVAVEGYPPPWQGFSDIALYTRFRGFLVAGFSLAWAVVFIFTYSFVFTPFEAFSAFQINASKVTYLGSIFVMQVVFYSVGRQVLAHDARLPVAVAATVVFLVLMTVYYLGCGLSLTPWALVAVVGMSGVWQGVFHVLWVEALAYFDDRVAPRVVYASIVAGAAVFMFVLYAAGGGARYAPPVLAVASLCCYAFTYQFRPQVQLSTKQVSRKLAKRLHKSNVIQVVFGAVFGMGIYACMTGGGPAGGLFNHMLIGAALLVGGAALLLMSLTRNRVYSLEEVTLGILPLVAIALLALLFVQGERAWMIYLVILLLLTVFDASCFVFQLRATREMDLCPLLSVARGRIYIQGGMVGAGLAYFLFSSFVDAGARYSYLIPLFLVFFLFVLISSCTKMDLMPVRVEPPLREARVTAEGEGACGAPVAPGVPERVSAVRAMTSDYDLTLRESEVLELLLAGYTINGMAEKYTISTNTVKTHLYHLYQKLGVSSRQEVVNLHEEVERGLRG